MGAEEDGLTITRVKQAEAVEVLHLVL